MKIKKRALKKLIESYLNEITPDIIDSGSGEAAARQASYTPGTVKDLKDLKWPQDFVFFEKQFESHIANWKLFKKEYPKSAFLLQIFDLSGVSSYGDLAKSIEDTASGNAGIYDQFILALNVFSALPIGVMLGLGSGRLAVKGLNSVTKLAKAEGGNGFQIISQFIKSSDKFRDLVNTGIVKSFLINTHKIAPKTADNIVVNLIKFLNFIDSFGFRAFMRSWVIISKNIAEDIQIMILEYLASETGAEFIRSSELSYYLFKKLPEKIGKYLDLEFSIN